jgi:hypothetical protein
MWRVVVLAAVLAVVWFARDAPWLEQLRPLIFSSPHQEYVAGLERSGMAEMSLARDWIAASTGALAQPTKVALPYERVIGFVGERPAAYAFLVRSTGDSAWTRWRMSPPRCRQLRSLTYSSQAPTRRLTKPAALQQCSTKLRRTAA